jgi:hypothetical protein
VVIGKTCSNIGAAEDSSTTCQASASKVSIQGGGLTAVILGNSHIRLLLLPEEEEEEVEILH